MNPLILIVEDEAMVSLALELAVIDLGMDVLGPAASVAHAIALLEGRSISGAILDGNLGDGDVTPLAWRLLDDAIPFILHSALVTPAILDEHLPASIPVIAKPSPPSLVIRALVELMDGV
ncbi:hypothetical protein ACFB49_16020 [Sphingomonas sp. DBB INV C78]|uniref:response regulator n=1 Tax=Sphingomonas sp. DBB INV C78 TaxID=3349434 RepID=UPI0036D3013D